MLDYILVWSEAKNKFLMKERNICFEDVIGIILNEEYLDVISSSTHKGQEIYVIKFRHYIYAVPFNVKGIAPSGFPYVSCARTISIPVLCFFFASVMVGKSKSSAVRMTREIVFMLLIPANDLSSFAIDQFAPLHDQQDTKIIVY